MTTLCIECFPRGDEFEVFDHECYETREAAAATKGGE